MENIYKHNHKILNSIQLLRGISVLLVFFYHLNLKYFDYGFLGVDIFFVISGFVITSMIYREVEITKKFSFYNFYLRRFKRIYPVLFFITTITLIFIIFFQPLDLFLNNLKVYFLSLLGVSNFFYLFSKKDYFDTVFDDPLAHTWSLGVEEQFYIIFPLLLYFLLKYSNYFKNIFIIILLIFLGIVFSNFFEDNIKLIFYSPLFRFWEFLIGSLTFFLTTKFNYKNNYYSLIMLFLLLFLIIFFKSNSLINTTLITCIFTSLFIFFYKENSNRLFILIVENKPLIFLGNISYSFYLWHLPIIYFYDLYFLRSFSGLLLLLFIILILSFFTYNFIEKKFRYYKFKIIFDFKNIVLGSVLFSLIIMINIIAFQDSKYSSVKQKFKNLIYSLNYLENKIDYTNRTLFYRINIDGNEIYRYCTENSDTIILNTNNLRKNCLKKGKNNNRIFYIEGNSHAANFIPMFNDLNIPDFIYYNHKTKILDIANFDYELIDSLLNSYNEVVYVTTIDSKKSLSRLIEIRKKINKNIKILILGTIPFVDLKIEPLKCFIKNITCEFDSFKDIQNRGLLSLNLEIEKLTYDSLNFNYFDPYKLICPQKICKVFDNQRNLLIYRDDSHLTIEGSLLIKDGFIKFYNNHFEN